MQIVIMRGLPGSGKSSWVKKNLHGNVVACSNDDYHVGPEGVYRFDPANAARAQDECLRKFMQTIQVNAAALLVVDNMNLTAWEISPYYRLAEVLKHEVTIIRMHCPFEVAARRNLHGIPPERVWQLHQVLQEERLPPWWKERLVLPD